MEMTKHAEVIKIKHPVLGYFLNLPWTMVGLILAIISIPKEVGLKEDAIVFKVRSFWWTRFTPGMRQLRIRGITNGNVISLGPLEEKNDLAHELVHVRQFMKKPFIAGFLYWRESKKHGKGLDNKYEREAYETTGSVYRGLVR
jgi:hypothetical protein